MPAHISTRFPFDTIHTVENPILISIATYLFNWTVPVSSETLQVPRQKRFRLDYRGNILDFDRMTDQEKEAYMNDEEEQNRQRSPGLRHRNGETISCRYSYISSRQKILESQKRIRNRVKPEPKLVKFYSAHRSAKVTNEINNNFVRTDRPVDCKTDKTDSNQKKGANPGKKLILFTHGGGFLCLMSRSYEVYLRKLVNQLGGVPLLAIDYSLAVPYPVASQELLDVYLWLFSRKPEVERMLGFHPEKIIVAGDSSGGFLTLSLTITLNELNKMLNKSGKTNGLHRPIPSSVPLPLSLVLAYPATTASHLSSGMCTSPFELIVECHGALLLISMLGANISTIGDLKRIENGECHWISSHMI